MANPAAKQSLSEMLSQAVNAASKNKTSTKTQAREDVKPTEDERFSNIASNTFYKIMFSEEMTPEQKKAEIASALSQSKEDNKAALKEFDLFKEYLQQVRKEMSQQIIHLTDTDAFSELKLVYDELDRALHEFNEKIEPLLGIVDAVNTLRTNGLTFDAFNEIREDREAEKVRAELIAGQEEKLRALEDEVRGINENIAVLSEDKGLFGFGGVKKSAREQIAVKNVEMTAKQQELADLAAEIEKTKAQQVDTESKLGEFVAQKEKLRELLDISTDEHKQRQKDLVDSALNFVKTSEERVRSVRAHLGDMGDQIERLNDANGKMTAVYAVLNEGIVAAVEGNQSKLKEYGEPQGDVATAEGAIAKMTRMQNKMAVESHLESLNNQARDTMKSFGDLTTQSIRIKGMHDNSVSQINTTREMHSDGVAGVADRLATVLQAVTSAALGESSAMAGMTLREMRDNTNLLAQKEVIRNAMGITDQNSALEKAIEDLAAYGETVKASNEITRQGVTEMKDKLDELRRMSESVKDQLGEAVAIHAESGLKGSFNPESAGESRKDAKGAPAPAKKPSNPFGLNL